MFDVVFEDAGPVLNFSGPPGTVKRMELDGGFKGCKSKKEAGKMDIVSYESIGVRKVAVALMPGCF